MRKILLACALCLCVHLKANVIDSWSSPPTTISTPGVDASNPYIGMDSNGNAVAVWLEGSALMADTMAVNGSWGTPVALSSSGASEASLVVDPAGNATVVWIEGGITMTSSLPVGSTWSIPLALSAAGSSSPQVAVRSNGDLAAVWLNNGVAQAVVQSFGSSWSAVSNLSGANAVAPQIAIGNNGTVVAVWHGQNPLSSISNINSAICQIGSSFSTASIISDPSVIQRFPSIGSRFEWKCIGHLV